MIFQIAGPDGNVGSRNEPISHTKTIGGVNILQKPYRTTGPQWGWTTGIHPTNAIPCNATIFVRSGMWQKDSLRLADYGRQNPSTEATAIHRLAWQAGEQHRGR